MKHIPPDIEGIERVTLIVSFWQNQRPAYHLNESEIWKMVARIGEKMSITRLLLDSYLNRNQRLNWIFG